MAEGKKGLLVLCGFCASTSDANKTIPIGNIDKSRNLQKKIINKFQIGLPVKIKNVF